VVVAESDAQMPAAARSAANGHGLFVATAIV
jgi:hypothetical protein